MIQLDFIPDETFRSVVEESFFELESAVQIGAWRGAMLLAGGLFESILTMYLLTKKQKAGANVDPLKLPIDQTMSACIKLGMQVAGSKEAKKLVLNYRKLIHPNADIRLRTQVLEADVREARMILNSILEYIRPTPIPWEEPEEPTDTMIELELEDDFGEEASWDRGEQSSGNMQENVGVQDTAPKQESNIRLPGMRNGAPESKSEPKAETNIRIPSAKSDESTASNREAAPASEEPRKEQNIRLPGQARENGATENSSRSSRRSHHIEPEPAPPAAKDAPKPDAKEALKQEAKPVAAKQETTLKQDARPKQEAAPKQGTPPRQEAKPVQVKAEPQAPAVQTAAPAANEVDPRAAIRAMDTAVDRNLRGEKLRDVIAPLDAPLQKELLKVLIPKSALRIHIGKEELSEIDRTAALLTLRDMFRQLLALQPESVREEVLTDQAAGLQADPPTKGVVYVDYLFEASDLDLLPPAQASVLKKYVFQRMEKHQSRFFLDSITDIWFYLSKEEIDEFTNVCLSCVIYGATHELRMETKGWLKRNAWEKMDPELRSDVLAPLQRWIENYEFFNDASHANLVRELKAIAERR